MSSKVLLIGWDAADWKVIQPLLDAGKLPSIARFIQEGVSGNIATLYPVLSPMLWTSIATGKRAFKHGIYGFAEPDPNGGGIQPITQLSRKTKTIWNILNQSGKQSNIVGWWPSHPAEPLNGVMVSNHFQKATQVDPSKWALPAECIYPSRLNEPLEALRVHPTELTAEHILPFVPKAKDVDQDKDKRLVGLAKTISETANIHAAATHLMEHEPWDFMAVYYDAIDHFGHGFMKFHPPKQQHIPEAQFEIYQNVIEAAYIYQDAMLGVMMDKVDDDTTVIILSDHGFHPDHLRPASIPDEPAGPAAEHRPFGVFMARGPNICQNKKIYGVSLLDIAPTLLTLFDLPHGEDMDGKVLMPIFKNTPQVKTIPSWDAVKGDDGMHPSDKRMSAVETQEALNQLIDLGYIEQPSEDQAKAIAETVKELDYNLARTYADAQRYSDAANILEKLFEKYPNEYRFGIELTQAYQSLKQLPEARKTLETTIANRKSIAQEARTALQNIAEEVGGKINFSELDKNDKKKVLALRKQANDYSFGSALLMASILQAEDAYEDALAQLKQAEATDNTRAQLYIMIGDLFLDMKNWQQAEEAFKRAHTIDDEHPGAHLGLSKTYLHQKRNYEAASYALSAVNLRYHNPQAHFFLGVAVHRVGQVDYAIRALEVAISQNANYIEAYKRLAYIYKNRFNDAAKAEEYTRLSQKARKRLEHNQSGRTPSNVEH